MNDLIDELNGEDIIVYNSSLEQELDECYVAHAQDAQNEQ